MGKQPPPPLASPNTQSVGWFSAHPNDCRAFVASLLKSIKEFVCFLLCCQNSWTEKAKSRLQAQRLHQIKICSGSQLLALYCTSETITVFTHLACPARSHIHARIRPASRAANKTAYKRCQTAAFTHLKIHRADSTELRRSARRLTAESASLTAL